MQQHLALFATLVSAFVGSAAAQKTSSPHATFSNTSFTAPVAVGQTWPISFTVGDGSPVSIVFGNSSWAFTVVDGLTAPGSYVWNVAVPVDTVAGLYQLALIQSGANEYSPYFELVIPSTASLISTAVPTTNVAFPAEPTTTVTITAVYLPTTTSEATVTFIYWEDNCGCHRTSSCAAEAMPPPSIMSTTTVVYYDNEGCGCSRTVEAPCAPTAMPVPVSMPASNWTAPPMNTPPAPATSPVIPSAPTYTGAAINNRVVFKFGLTTLITALALVVIA